MIRCIRYRKDISALLDDELTGAERIRLEAHLQQCGRCRGYFESLQRTERSVMEYVHERKAAMPEPVGPVEFPEFAAPAAGPGLRGSNISTRKLPDFTGHEEISIGMDGAGSVVHSPVSKLIPAILVALATILLYTSELKGWML